MFAGAESPCFITMGVQIVILEICNHVNNYIPKAVVGTVRALIFLFIPKNRTFRLWAEFFHHRNVKYVEVCKNNICSKNLIQFDAREAK